MTPVEPNDPAFSRSAAYGDHGNYVSGDAGISIRTYLAGLAMQGLCAHYGYGLDADETALKALQRADALVAALNKPST